MYEPNTPLPAVLISYPSPPSSDPDAVTLEVLDAILSRGDSSRLHDTLVYRDRIASEVGVVLRRQEGRGNLGVFAILSGGKDAATGEASLRREVARFCDLPVTSAELQEAKTELLTAALRERETVAGRADELARAITWAGDARAADRRLKQIAAVTRRTFSASPANGCATMRALRSDICRKNCKRDLKEDVIGTSAKVQTARWPPPISRSGRPASDSERVAPPPPGPEITPAIPKPAIQRLANGLSVITVEKHDLPLVTAMLVDGRRSDGRPGQPRRHRRARRRRPHRRHGRAVGDPGRPGRRGARRIARRRRRLGRVAARATGRHGGARQGARDPRRRRPQRRLPRRGNRTPAHRRDQLGVRRHERSGSIAQMAALRALYGDGAYGHPSSGTPKSLHAIGRGDLEAAYRSAWEPGDVTLVLTGDITPAKARALAERNFGSWQGKVSAEPAAATAGSAPLRGRLVVVDMPGSGQAAVAVARTGVSRSEERFYPALVANAVLGGGYSARLNQEIRIKRGLSYGSGSSLDARREAGPFMAITQTRNDAADQVVALTLGEMTKLGSETVSPADLKARRSSLTGSFGRNVETTAGTASVLAGYVQRGVPPETLDTYLPSVLQVSPADVQAVASNLLKADGATVVVVGDAKQFADKLKAKYPDLVLIPLKELDLNSASLRKVSP